MDPQEFQHEAERNQRLADYLDEIAQNSSPAGQDRSLGLDFLFVVATYAVYHWVRTFIDHRRGLNEAELRQQMEKEIDRFIQSGHTPEQALQAVLEVSKAVAAKPPDEALLDIGRNLLDGQK